MASMIAIADSKRKAIDSECFLPFSIVTTEHEYFTCEYTAGLMSADTKSVLDAMLHGRVSALPKESVPIDVSDNGKLTNVNAPQL